MEASTSKTLVRVIRCKLYTNVVSTETRLLNSMFVRVFLGRIFLISATGICICLCRNTRGRSHNQRKSCQCV